MNLAGITAYLHTLDIAINKLFKNYLRMEINDYIENRMLRKSDIFSLRKQRRTQYNTMCLNIPPQNSSKLSRILFILRHTIDYRNLSNDQ
ncbi:Hypothetical predicted protein [Octopus vulgaris]|uniref:Uncharacterized protein n=1 Tax=Octopus vulgaris TaxID=6645 RepID=A0AA36BB49_OCTVU|nr:Hypothetical predicted protein [Octopus vulgaris]